MKFYTLVYNVKIMVTSSCHEWKQQQHENHKRI